MRDNQAGATLCQEAELGGVKQCLSSGESTVYKCHAGLTHIAVPITLDARPIGVIHGGLFREAGDEGSENARLSSLSDQIRVSFERLSKEYKDIPIARQNDIQKVLFQLTEVAADFMRIALTPPHFSVEETLQQVRELTPDLIAYLKQHESDLIKLNWEIFEHLIAEFFAGWGFSMVRLVGKTITPAADIFAVEKRLSTGGTWRYFIEVKRWRERVGIEVVDRVYGAMLRERDKWGWHVAMICSVAGFADFRATDTRELRLRGVELRGKEDICEWLRAYRPSKSGLWLPKSDAMKPVDPQSI